MTQKSKKSLNNTLHQAKRNKNDEFYTQLTDIEKELRHYKDQLRWKTIFCNCDDPVFSNFFVYFYNNFQLLWLKKLIATHFKYENKQSYKLVVTGEDLDRDGKILEVTELRSIIEDFKHNPQIFDDHNLFTDRLRKADISLELLEGDGDFRSEECIELLQESDIVVTNPPFSLFREYVGQLIAYKKSFLILWNMNAITYKEIFPLIKDNKIWAWYGFNMSMVYRTPYENTLEANRKFVIQKWYDPDFHIKVPAINRYTNLDTNKRHEELVLYKHYDPAEYPKYENYNAINVNKVTDIPLDYDGVMGVPITFVDKHNPDQFEIIGLGISNSWIEVGVEPYKKEHKKYRREVQKRWAVDWDLYMMVDWIVTVPYARILIKKK